MKFSINQIRKYLFSQKTIPEAVFYLSEESLSKYDDNSGFKDEDIYAHGEKQYPVQESIKAPVGDMFDTVDYDNEAYLKTVEDHELQAFHEEQLFNEDNLDEILGIE